MNKPVPRLPQSNCTSCPLIHVSVLHRLNTIGGITPKAIELRCWATGDTIWTFFLNTSIAPDYEHKMDMVRTIATLMNGWLDHPLINDLADRAPPYPCRCTTEQLEAAMHQADHLRSVQGRTLANKTRWQGELTLFTQATEIHSRLANEWQSRQYHTDKE